MLNTNGIGYISLNSTFSICFQFIIDLQLIIGIVDLLVAYSC